MYIVRRIFLHIDLSSRVERGGQGDDDWRRETKGHGQRRTR